MNLSLSINIHGRLLDLSVPKVMGILNVTPDSFYAGSRNIHEDDIRNRLIDMCNAGVDIIDIGGCSTRPGYTAPSEKEEWERVNLGCLIANEVCPDIPLSVDTYRTSVAERAVKERNVSIINDISGGIEHGIWDVAAGNHVAYILTHNSGNILPDNVDITADVVTDLSKKMNELRRLGVNDVILDPGFGFAKTQKQNFQLLAELEEIVRMGAPVLVGISRKSMIYTTLEVSPDQALVGTISLNTVALMKGASIIRVHDIKEAKETVKLVERIKAMQ